MKPMNWISATGLSPSAAIPMAMPAMRVSDSGVSSTRSAPKRCASPAVARNTPPFTPTSSPRTMTPASAAISWAKPRLTASMSVSSGIGCGRHRAPLFLQGVGEARVDVLEHRLGWQGGEGEVAGDG